MAWITLKNGVHIDLDNLSDDDKVKYFGSVETANSVIESHKNSGMNDAIRSGAKTSGSRTMVGNAVPSSKVNALSYSNFIERNKDYTKEDITNMKKSDAKKTYTSLVIEKSLVDKYWDALSHANASDSQQKTIEKMRSEVRERSYQIGKQLEMFKGVVDDSTRQEAYNKSRKNSNKVYEYLDNINTILNKK